MASFDEVAFVQAPTLALLQGAKISKDQWKFIARYYRVEYSSSNTKQQIRDLVTAALVSRSLLPSSVLEDEVFAKSGDNNVSGDDNLSVKSDSSISSCKSSELELKLMAEKRLEREWERERFFLTEKAEKEKFERETARENEKFEKEAALMRERLALEERNLQLQFQIHQHSSANLSTNTGTSQSLSLIKTFDVSKNAQLVGNFMENDPEAFFEMFERLASQLEWDQRYWTILVQTKLVGKARQVYSNLSNEDSQNYEIVKKTILLAYDQVEETYRQRFRGATKSQTSTYIEFADELSRLLDK